MWKDKLKANPKGIGFSVLALGVGTALTLGLFGGGGTLAAWSSNNKLPLDSTIQIDWEDPTPPTITTESLAKGFVGEAYSVPLEGEGSGAHSLSSGSLPDGLTIDSKSGSISGKPTKKGVFTFTILKTNKMGQFSREFTVEISYAAPTITNEKLATARKGESYRETLLGAGEGSTYSISSGSLPTGLNFDPTTGTFGGTATVTGLYPITVTKTNESGSVQKSFTLEVKLAAPKFISGTQLPSGNMNVLYERPIRVDGEELTFTADEIPAWLSLNAKTGILTGTPPTMETVYVNVKVSNSGGEITRRFYIPIQDTPPIFVTQSLPDGEVALPYSAKVEVQQTDAKLEGATGLPSGLSFNRTTGEITGTPRFSGTFTVRFEASRNYVTSYQTLQLFIETDGPTITTKELPDAVQNTFYYQQLAGKGENSAYALSAGTLPGTLSIDSAKGVISGQPGNTAHGLYTFTVTKTNEKGVAFKELSIYVRYEVPTLNNYFLSRATKDRDYSATPPTGVGNASTYSLSSGRLPSGLSLDPVSGIIGGAATEVGDFEIVLRKENESGFAERKATLSVIHKIPVFVTKSIPDPRIGEQFSFQLEATGEDITYSSDLLPEGFFLDEKTGLITGYTELESSKFVRFYAKNSGGSVTYSQTFKVVSAPPLFTVEARLPNAIVGVPYYYQLKASGANISYSFPQGGGFAAGLSFDGKTGIISGTPTSAIVDKVTIVSVSNSGGRDTKNFYMTVVTQPPTITLVAFQDAIGGKTYSQPIAGEGSSNTWTISSGALPKGLNINASSGTVSGTPTDFGLFNFTVTKTNASGSTSKAFTLKVGYENPTITNSSTEYKNYVGFSYTYPISGGGYGSTLSITSGTLPAGLTIDQTISRITGKPTETGVFVFTVTRGNPESSVSKEFTFTVTDAPPTLPASTTITFTESTQIDYLVGGTGENVTYSLSKGSVLPAGLNLDPVTGRITGITTDMGNKNVYITKSNSWGPVEVRYTYSVIYAKPFIETTSLPAATVGVPYSAFIYATGKEVVYTSGTLPSGLTLNSVTGEISGTPTSRQPRNVQFSATNSGGTMLRTIMLPFT